MNKNYTLLSILIIIGSFIIGGCIYSAIIKSRLSDRYITVKGIVEQIEKADYGAIELTFKVSDNNFAALTQKLESKTKLIQDFIVNQGFTNAEIARSAPLVTDLFAQEYNASKDAPQRYIINQTIIVSSAKVDLIESLSSQLSQLIVDGINITRNYKTFYLDRFNKLRPQLIAKATQNAQEMANQFAKTAECKITKIRRANQGVIVLSGVNSSPSSDYESGSDSLMKKIRVVMTMEFLIN